MADGAHSRRERSRTSRAAALQPRHRPFDLCDLSQARSQARHGFYDFLVQGKQELIRANYYPRKHRDEAQGKPVQVTVLDRMPVSEDERIKIVPTNPDDLVVNGLSMSAGESADSDDKKEWGRPRPSSNEEMRLDGLSVLTQDAQPSSAWNIYVSFLVAAKPWMLRCYVYDRATDP
ncbi:hypothetical protein F4823DRAFT_561572 [Ustulina deusta]|nr:hypothetical protein F4823DRAFT_561572 [Ustulina deusta]